MLETACWSPDGHSIAVVAVTNTSPGSKRQLTLDVVDLMRPTGGFQYLADLGAIDNNSASPPVAPVAWEPCETETCSASERLVYLASVPGQKSGAGGPLGLLSLVTAPAAVSGALFESRPALPGLLIDDAPRLGNVTGLVGLAWRSPGSGTDGVPLLGFARSSRSALSLRAIDPESGRVEDLGVELGADVASGATVIGFRWDFASSRGLLLARASDHLTSVQPPAVDVWLFDFGDDKGHAQ
jgi:hypothetical protein